MLDSIKHSCDSATIAKKMSQSTQIELRIWPIGPVIACAHWRVTSLQPIYELAVKNLTSPFASATPISCNRGITLLSKYIFAMFFCDLFSVHAQK